MKKKQCKEMANVVKSQCSSIEKAAKGKTFNTVEQVMKCHGSEPIIITFIKLPPNGPRLVTYNIRLRRTPK